MKRAQRGLVPLSHRGRVGEGETGRARLIIQGGTLPCPLVKLQNRMKPNGESGLQAAIKITAICFLIFSQPVFAKPSTCTITSTPVNFGAYSVFSMSPNNNSGGSIIIVCTNGSGGPFDVMLSTGASNGYASRVMKSGINTLNYNLYTSAARTAVWGDGTGGSSVMRANKGGTTTLTLFGQIPAEKDANVGTYSDSITATVNF